MAQHNKYTAAFGDALARLGNADKLRSLITMGRMELPRAPEASTELPSNINAPSLQSADVRQHHDLDEAAQRFTLNGQRAIEEGRAVARTRYVPKDVPLDEYMRRRALHGPSLGEYAQVMYQAATDCPMTIHELAPNVRKGWLEATQEFLAGSINAPVEMFAENMQKAYTQAVGVGSIQWANATEPYKEYWRRAAAAGLALRTDHVVYTNAQAAKVVARNASEMVDTTKNPYRFAEAAAKGYWNDVRDWIKEFSPQDRIGWITFAKEVLSLNYSDLRLRAALARQEYHRGIDRLGDCPDWKLLYEPTQEMWVRAAEAVVQLHESERQ